MAKINGNGKKPLPIICGGDVFDKWNSPPELINFAIKNLPEMYAIPGQHDLPFHNYADIEKSAYWTLVEAGIIQNLSPSCEFNGQHVQHILGTNVFITAFPWGFEPFPNKAKYAIPEELQESSTNLAVCHKYIWYGDAKYPEAPKESHAGKLLVAGYDCVLLGDNHKSFFVPAYRSGRASDPYIFNPGSFMRRKSDEVGHFPMVGLLRRNGNVQAHFLNITNDKILSTTEVNEHKGKNPDIDAEAFMLMLGELGDHAINFSESVKHLILDSKNVSAGIKRIVEKCMEDE